MRSLLQWGKVINMKHLKHGSGHDAKLFGLLLMPSWLSTIIGATISLGIVVYTLVSAHYRGSNAQLTFLNYGKPGLDATTQSVSNRLASNELLANLPLFIFWALVGAVVYMFAINIFTAFKYVAEVTDEIEHYENVNRRQLIRVAVEKLAIRLGVLLVWIPYVLLFFSWVVPYGIAASLAASADFPSFSSGAIATLAVIILFAAIHLHVVLLRLLTLRVRLFSSAVYVD